MTSRTLNDAPFQLISICTNYHPVIAQQLIDAGLLAANRLSTEWVQLCLSDSDYVCTTSYSTFSDSDCVLTQTQFIELAQELSIIPRVARESYVLNRLETLGLV